MNGSPDSRATSPYKINFLQQDEPGGVDDVDTWLAITVAMIPVASIVGIVAHYVLGEQHVGYLWSLLTGLGVAIGMFVVLYVLYQRFRFNTAQHASVVTYNDLCEQMHRIMAIQEPSYSDNSLQMAAQSAFAEVRTCGEAFDYARNKRGLQWVLGKGYVDLARKVHRAEEAALLYEPVHLVLGDGWKDQSRVDGSTLPHADDLMNRIRRALITLDPDTELYLPQLPPKIARGEMSGDHPGVSAETYARVVLSDVHYAIHDFRDSARAELIDARNELLARMFLTGLATALLLVFIVLGRPQELPLLTGAILYAIGATVGLFSRLYADLNSGTVGEDFAISYVRLFQTFLLSGHAAIAGVYIVVALPFALNNPVLQLGTGPSMSATVTTGASAPGLAVAASPISASGAASPATAATPTSAEIATAVDRSVGAMPRLENVYNVDRYPFSIIVAMVFGLAPGMLISRLSQAVEISKQALRSSELSSKSRN